MQKTRIKPSKRIKKRYIAFTYDIDIHKVKSILIKQLKNIENFKIIHQKFTKKVGLIRVSPKKQQNTIKILNKLNFKTLGVSGTIKNAIKKYVKRSD